MKKSPDCLSYCTYWTHRRFPTIGVLSLAASFSGLIGSDFRLLEKQMGAFVKFPSFCLFTER